MLLAPAVLALSYVVLVLVGRAPPDPWISLLAVPVFIVVFGLVAVSEEAGWSGYLTDPLVDRWGALRAGIGIGTVWALWHVLGWGVQSDHTWAWTAGMALCTVAWRVLMVWLYVNTGRSVLAVVLLHTTINIGEFLFPNYGSCFDPVVAAAIAVPAAAVVVVLWDPRTPTRFVSTTR